MKKNLMIPAGKLAGFSDEEMKRRNQELARKLLEGKKVEIGFDGNVTRENQGGMTIPAGKLAGLSDDEMKRKNQDLARRLLEGEKVNIGSDGNVTRGNQGGMVIPAGKLAAALQPWYKKNPELFEAEIEAMSKYFPQFQLGTTKDGKLCWTGSLNVGIIGDNKWYVRAEYQNNHPYQDMGSSVHVYLIDPTDIHDLIKTIGWTPRHLIKDGKGGLYLCTAQPSDVRTSAQRSTTAASVMGWAVKWLMSLELVLTGNLAKDKFNADLI